MNENQNNMNGKTTLVMLIVVVTFSSCTSRKDLQVTAAINDVSTYPNSELPITYINCIIHSPKAYQGLSMAISTKASTRKNIREEYPIGSIISFDTPTDMANSLDSARKQFEYIEFRLDTGEDPYMISSVLDVPIVKIESLRSPIRKIEID